MSAPRFPRLAVVGMGLLGGSVALAARARGVASEVRGVDPALETADSFPLVSLAEAAAWADLVVLAAPLDAIEGICLALAPALRPETLLTDVASVKEPMAAIARRCLPYPENCVGAHPMAGHHTSGFASARPDLFNDAACFVTPEGSEPAQVVDRIDEFWQCLGAFTVRKTPEEHDRITAVLSHTPHLIAFAFAQGLGQGQRPGDEPGEEWLRFAGPGFLDFIRIARANPALWCEILLMNQRRVAEESARFQDNFTGFLDALANGDKQELESRLRESQANLTRIEHAGD